MPDPIPSQWGLNLGIWFQNSGVCAGPREPIKLVKGEMLLTGLGFWGDLGPLLAATQAGLAQAERAGLWTGQAEPGERPEGRGRGRPWGRRGKRAVSDTTCDVGVRHPPGSETFRRAASLQTELAPTAASWKSPTGLSF